MLRIEKGVFALYCKDAQQFNFISSLPRRMAGDTLISDKLKWLYNFASLRAWHSSNQVCCFASRIKNSIWKRSW